MFESWKFSKGNYLTLALTALSAFLVIGYAHSQHRSSEILTGVIGGLTVILGIITAEWLRSAREQVEMTRKRFHILAAHFTRYLYNFDEYMEDPFSHEHQQHVDDLTHVATSLSLLSRTTRWPQPNAKKIREVAWELYSRMWAVQTDAMENECMWSLEERMTLANDLHKLSPLIWGRKLGQIDNAMESMMKYRKTPRNQGIPDTWKKRRSK